MRAEEAIQSELGMMRKTEESHCVTGCEAS